MKETIVFLRKYIYPVITILVGIGLYFFALKYDLFSYRIELNKQYEYGKYLIDQNDEIMKRMIDFEKTIAEEITKPVHENKTKDYLSKLIVEQNKILEEVTNEPPNTSNADYQTMYDAFLKAHAFYIQGQIMKLENIYDKRKTEQYVLGDQLTSVAGNVIYALSYNINLVRETDYPYEYGVEKAFQDPNDNPIESIGSILDEKGFTQWNLFFVWLNIQ